MTSSRQSADEGKRLVRRGSTSDLTLSGTCASKDAVFTIGPYTFRPSSKILLNPEGNEVRLTEKETGVLRYLCRAGQRPVSRETLLQEVWGYNSGLTTHTLETHIYRLRQKIEKDATSPAILVTQADGYTLVP